MSKNAPYIRESSTARNHIQGVKINGKTRQEIKQKMLNTLSSQHKQSE